MPYRMEKRGKKWVIVGPDGKVVGEHPSEKDAMAQMAVLQKKVMAKEATDEEKKAQQARSTKYGIGIKAGGNVTKPADYADVPEEQFADPVNFRYPLSPPARAVNTITRFNDTANKAAGGYSDGEWAKMGERIAKANKGKVYKDGQIVDRKQEAKMGDQHSLDDQVRAVRDSFEVQFCKMPNGEYNYRRRVLDTYSDHVVAMYDDQMFSISYEIGKDGIAFAPADKWVKVEKAYTAIAEAVRIIAAKKKGDEEPEGREWEVVIIGPETDTDLVTEGQETYIRSKNGRLYQASALEASVPLWDGVKVYDNHLTDAQMQATQGMRSVVNEWVGVIVQPAWDAAKKAVTGVLKVVDDTLRSKLLNASKAGVLDKIGLSIDALGEGKEAKVAGAKTSVVTKISRALSVDVVADPAAGGRLARMIAGMSPLQPVKEDLDMDPEELKKMIEAAIAAGNAGLVQRLEALEARVAEGAGNGAQPPEGNGDDTPTDDETQKTLAEAKKVLADAQKALQEAEQKTKLHECGLMLSSKLQASGLMPSFQGLVAEQYRGRVFEEKDLDETIKKFREAQAKLSESGGIVLPEGARISVSPVVPYDHFALGFLRLVAGNTRFGELVTKENAEYHGFDSISRYIEAGKPNLPVWRRLSEWYFDFADAAKLDPYNQFGGMALKEANILSTTVASIVKNTVNLLMAADYDKRQRWWEPIVRNEDVDTLDQATLVRVFGINTLSTIAEGDAYVETDWEDEEETASWVKRGNYIGVSLETFLLDKLNIVRALPNRLATAWYNTISSLVSAVFTVNTAAGPVLADTGALFNATALTSAGGHANLGTTALSYATFVAGRLAMMKQTDQPLGVGQRMGIRPKYLLVPMDLLATAEKIRNSELIPAQDAVTTATAEFQSVNSVKGTFEIVTVPHWTDVDNWALVGDPAEFPAIWLIWLRGRRTPELFSAEDDRAGAMFTNDELRYKVRQYGFRFSASYDCAPVSDFRPLYKANV